MAKVSTYSDCVTCLRYDLDVACPLFRLLISCRLVSATKTTAAHDDEFLQTAWRMRSVLQNYVGGF